MENEREPTMDLKRIMVTKNSCCFLCNSCLSVLKVTGKETSRLSRCMAK